MPSVRIYKSCGYLYLVKTNIWKGAKREWFTEWSTTSYHKEAYNMMDNRNTRLNEPYGFFDPSVTLPSCALEKSTLCSISHSNQPCLSFLFVSVGFFFLSLTTFGNRWHGSVRVNSKTLKWVHSSSFEAHGFQKRSVYLFSASTPTQNLWKASRLNRSTFNRLDPATQRSFPETHLLSVE